MNSISFSNCYDQNILPEFKPGDIIEVDFNNGSDKKYYILSFTHNCEKGYYGSFQFIDVESGYLLLDKLICYKFNYDEIYSDKFGGQLNKMIYNELQNMVSISWKYIGQCTINIIKK